MDPADLKAVASALHAARSVCISTGAGMSAESGVPTFRDAQTGMWSKFRPEDLATPEAFQRDPRTVWAWYRTRRALKRVSPHVGHELLVEWEQRIDDFTIVTQNVDGLHHHAGSNSVIELHGRLDVARCESCTHRVTGLDDLGEDPRCDQCQARLRPGVVWFGEALPDGAIDAAFDSAQRCDVLLVIGTSGVVQPAASLAEVASQTGATVVEINPNATPISSLANARLRAPCGEALAAIDAEWRAIGS